MDLQGQGRKSQMDPKLFRIGQIVPSSNTTMETEIPEFLRAFAAQNADVAFSFHSSRMRMKRVTASELASMDADSHRCAAELADAPIDVAAYACLVAIMARGKGFHRESGRTLAAVARNEGKAFPVVTSAGALVEELRLSGYRRVALVMPYADDLARTVADYVEAEGITVCDYRNFSVTDNAEVGRIPGERLLSAAAELDLSAADAVVLSACVQMPSIQVLEAASRRVNLPITSTAQCTANAILRALGLHADDRVAA